MVLFAGVNQDLTCVVKSGRSNVVISMSTQEANRTNPPCGDADGIVYNKLIPVSYFIPFFRSLSGVWRNCPPLLLETKPVHDLVIRWMMSYHPPTHFQTCRYKLASFLIFVIATTKGQIFCRHESVRPTGDDCTPNTTPVFGVVRHDVTRSQNLTRRGR